MSLARKLLAVTVLIAVLAIAAIMGATWNAASEAQHGLLRQRVADDVSREARMLESSLAMIVSDMGMLAEGGAAGLAGEYSGPSIDNLQILVDQVNALMRKRPAYDEIRVELQGVGAPRTLISRRLDDTVRTMVDPPTSGAGFDVLLRERQGLRNSNGLWGGEASAANGDTTGRGVLPRAVFLRAPVKDRSGAVIGAVAITADFGRLVGTLARPQDDIQFWVSDATGRFLHRSGPAGGEAGPAPQANAVDRYGLRDVWGDWLKGSDPQRQVDQPSRAQIVVLNRVAVGEPGGQVDGEFLVVGGSASFAALDAGATAFRNRVAFAVLVVGVLMVFSLALATGLLVQPIEALTGVANRIAAGEPGVAAPVARQDEIGILARAMVRMADELRKAGKTSEQAALGRMASMIAHDLRNALSSVKMNLQILDNHHRQTGEAEAGNCEIALDQVRYMEVILQDMLAFARPGSVELDWTDIGEVLRTAAISLLPEQQRRSVTLELRGDGKLPTVLGDRNKLLQVFQNLLENAIHASSEGAVVEVDAEPLLHDSRPAVQVRIRDHGPGMAPDAEAKAFEPFFTTKAKGTGLGLAIVQRIVRQHSGEVGLASADGGGAVATVVLPVTPAEPETGIRAG